MYTQEHLEMIRNGKVLSIQEKTKMSSVSMFKVFEDMDLEMNKYIVIVTYSGLTEFPNMYQAVWKGIDGRDFYKFTDDNEALNAMNEFASKYTN